MTENLSEHVLEVVGRRLGLGPHVVVSDLDASDPEDGMVMLMVTCSSGARHIASAESLGLPHPASKEQVLDALRGLDAED